MDIEFSQEQVGWEQVFQPIANFAISGLYQRQITLENTFTHSLQQSTHDVLLTLIDNTLLLSNPQLYQVQPYAALLLDFDLKFQVIYQVPQNVTSRKLGLKLFYDSLRSFTFYSVNLAVVEAWVLVLSKKLNQKGFHEMFKPLKKLGKGNFASVYEVQRITDGRRFAVKAFSKQSCFNAKNGKQSLINELTIMRTLSLDPHPNVLKLQAVFESDNSIYVVLQLLTGNQLFLKIQQNNGYFSSEEVKEFMVGLLSGMRQMHGQRIMHRDLKPQNIMLRSNGSMSPVIVDFGLATPADLEKYLFFRCGTPGYVAPQIIELNESKHIEPECDIFSAGVIFHILLTRKAVFEGTKYEQVYRKNKQMKIVFQGQRYNNVEQSALDLLKSMLSANPKQRVSANEALNHPYLQSYMREQEEMGDIKISSPCHTAASDKKKVHNFVSKK